MKAMILSIFFPILVILGAAAFGQRTDVPTPEELKSLVKEYQDLKDAFDNFDITQGKPTVIIAHTVKGKGVSFMEGKCAWHGKAPNKEQLAAALLELGEDR